MKLSVNPDRRQNSPSFPSRCVAVPVACWVRCERGDYEATCWPQEFSSPLYFLVWAPETGVKAHGEDAGSPDLCAAPHHWWTSSSSGFLPQYCRKPVSLRADSLNPGSLIGEEDIYNNFWISLLKKELLFFYAMLKRFVYGVKIKKWKHL